MHCIQRNVLYISVSGRFAILNAGEIRFGLVPQTYILGYESLSGYRILGSSNCKIQITYSFGAHTQRESVGTFAPLLDCVPALADGQLNLEMHNLYRIAICIM